VNDAPRLERAAPDVYRASGAWRIDDAADLYHTLDSLDGQADRIDARELAALDSAGALILLLVASRLEVDPTNIELREEHAALFAAIVAARSTAAPTEVHVESRVVALLRQIGGTVVAIGADLKQLLGFLGRTLARFAWSWTHPQKIPWTSVVYHMEQTGLDALPLVMLLSFLIGAVVSFLGATVLRDFGAELFVIDLTSYAFLREFGVMLTAILLAGRTASAFTAQIGTMKSREEIDAMLTLGLDPVDLLVFPRLAALLVMLPLLSVGAVLAGIGGGMLVAWLSLDIVPALFLNHLHETISIRHYLVGLGKAPVFALVIALVGCLEGFKVTGTAQSVGERTTSAVVQAITLVILIDALAAIFFMEMGW